MVKLNITETGFIQFPFDDNLPSIEVTDEEFAKIQNGELKLVNGVLTDISQKLEKQNQIKKLTKQLEETDYIANKLIEAETEEERQQLRLQYATQLANRKQWRKEISALQDKLKILEQELDSSLDQSISENTWNKVTEYCSYGVQEV